MREPPAEPTAFIARWITIVLCLLLIAAIVIYINDTLNRHTCQNAGYQDYIRWNGRGLCIYANGPTVTVVPIADIWAINEWHGVK